MAERSIKALLFSDVNGFSRMTERQCFDFCTVFHARVQNDVLARYDHAITLKNTWGDALHIVMDDITLAARLALDLRDWVQAFPWSAHGLPAHMDIRIGLHVGVVSKVPDPIVGSFNYIGRNTSKAARIEPITFEGQVFVSQAYAALLAVEDAADLRCEYVGTRELPKNAGSLQVYLLKRIPLPEHAR